MSMIQFKQLDQQVQLILISVALMGNLFFGLNGDTFFFGSYFVVGAWQIMSVIVHFFYKAPPYNTTMRKIYLYILLAVIILLPIGTTVGNDDTTIMTLFALLFVSALMAIYYLLTCIRETKELKKLSAAQAELPRAS